METGRLRRRGGGLREATGRPCRACLRGFWGGRRPATPSRHRGPLHGTPVLGLFNVKWGLCSYSRSCTPAPGHPAKEREWVDQGIATLRV